MCTENDILDWIDMKLKPAYHNVFFLCSKSVQSFWQVYASIPSFWKFKFIVGWLYPSL